LKKKYFIRWKSGKIIKDSDEEVIAEKKRKKILLSDDKNYAYDYYGNRNWDCVKRNF
jgi:hypothetical protein